MRTFDSGKSDFGRVGPVEVARWEHYGIETAMPFGAMWYTVPPGNSSDRDCHPEPELSIVVSGSGFVETAGGTVEVTTGTAFLLESEEAHVVHNRTEDVPLTIFSAYWMPIEDSAAQRTEEPASV